MKNISVLFLVVICTAFACVTQSPEVLPKPIIPVEQNITQPKNIILLIGDGMGLTQITAGTYANGNHSALEDFEYVGLHKSHASNNLITDSAAGATAFACGAKSYNGAIAVSPDTTSLLTILEEADARGLKTGLVASSSIVHATPASFIAHNKYRKNYQEIAEDFLDTDIDYFVGGGLKHFTRRSIDERNIVDELRAKGYVISDFFQDDLALMDLDPQTKFGFFTADEEPLPALQGRDYLPVASQKGIDFLDQKSDKGFFMMVEGSQIDWGGHANVQEYIISEFIDFNKVIQYALDFAKKDKETLVIVTADHETGGFAIQSGSTMDSLVTAFTSDYHTAVMIPVFAYGPGAEAFSGIYENTAIYNKMRNAYGWPGPGLNKLGKDFIYK